MKKSLITLALGTFGLGITEFVMMGILPYIAHDFGISMPEAGHLISAYAVGVCIGAPLMVLVARTMPLKRILYLLLAIYVTASFLMSVCPSNAYWLMFAFRLLAGIPHGAYFGVSSIVADRIAPPGKSTFAVAVMCSGMTFANLIGIPLGTFLAGLFSWRVIFVFSALWGMLTLGCIVRFIPFMKPLPNTGFKGQFRFMRNISPWLIVGATLLGNCGAFCWYSYVSPSLTEVAGVPSGFMSLMMVLAGAGMVVGNILGGRLSDVFTPGRTGCVFECVMFLSLMGLYLFADSPVIAVVLMIFTVMSLFAVSSPQQLLLLRCSKGGELMGGAMIQLAFNLGNAIGAYCGALPIVYGYSYDSSALVGAAFALMGIVCYVVFCIKCEPKIEV